jgi:hypothetical protein
MTRMDTSRPRRPELLRLSLPTGSDPVSIRARVTAMEMLLERSLVIPGINMPLGLDTLLGLVPVLGDVITAAMGAYIVWEAKNLGLPKWKLAQMGANILLDTVIGALPVIGDAADLMFRSNSKNLKILLRHIDQHHPEARMIEG